MSESRPLSRRILRAVLLTLLAVVLFFVFYIAVVMGQPQTDSRGGAPAVNMHQPLPAPLPAPLALSSDQELGRLAEAFPAPVMFAGSKALTFLQGECADVPFEEGVARVVTLTYRTADFDTLTVQSIYPARALSLLNKDGRSFTGMSTDNMAGMKFVTMKDATTLRLHAQGEEALYVFTTPVAERGTLDQWTNALQLYRPTAE